MRLSLQRLLPIFLRIFVGRATLYFFGAQKELVVVFDRISDLLLNLLLLLQKNAFCLFRLVLKVQWDPDYINLQSFKINC